MHIKCKTVQNIFPTIATLELNIFITALKNNEIAEILLNLIWPGGEGGTGGTESARADFNPSELPCYLRNTYRILALLLKFTEV